MLYKTLSTLASDFLAAPRAWCIGAPLALDFETAHLLDSIAYHHLLGADCFVFVVDEPRSRSDASLALRRLLNTTQPRLVALVQHSGRLGSTDPRKVVKGPLLRLLKKRTRVEFFSYIDADEFVVLSPTLLRRLSTEQQPPQPSQQPQQPPPSLPSLLPFLRSTLPDTQNSSAAGGSAAAAATTPNALYLHAWLFGAGGHTTLHASQLAATPEVGLFTRRGWGRERACVRTMAPYGKMIGRVASAWALRTIHAAAAEGSVLALPGGQQGVPCKPATEEVQQQQQQRRHRHHHQRRQGRGSAGGSGAAAVATPRYRTMAGTCADACEVQPLSISHYLGPLSVCLAKAAHGRTPEQGYSNQRSYEACARDFGVDADANATFEDDSLAVHAAAIRAHALRLFGGGFLAVAPSPDMPGVTRGSDDGGAARHHAATAAGHAVGRQTDTARSAQRQAGRRGSPIL